ncbi:hypothetical protein Syun_005482 [Stephania yunnanensis]|uniref:Uncharacterized protein n=1 Tax=Stephania yunnanensis TaxID=152371 RepID=A0AAP0L7I0_9MAGN
MLRHWANSFSMKTSIHWVELKMLKEGGMHLLMLSLLSWQGNFKIKNSWNNLLSSSYIANLFLVRVAL